MDPELPTPTEMETPPTSVPSTPISLPSAMQLLSEALSIYADRIGTFLGILVLPTIPALVLGVLLTFLPTFITPENAFHQGIFLIPAVILFAIGAIFLGLWSAAALGYAIKDRAERISIKESYRRGRSIIGSLFGLYFLFGLMSMGAFLLFFIPGILFTLYFSLAMFVLIAEGDRGMTALMKSREYIRGMGGKVLWLFGFIGIISILISIAESFLGKGTIAQLIRSTISFLIAPISSIYGFLIYEHLRAIKGVVQPAPKKKYVLVSTAGFVLVPVIILIVFLVNR